MRPFVHLATALPNLELFPAAGRGASKKAKAILILFLLNIEMRTFQQVIHVSIPGCEADVAVWMVLLEKSLVLHLGDASGLPSMPQLALSMPATFGGVGPVSSTLFDETDSSGDDYSESLSRRIAQRCSIQCFVTENLRNEWKQDELLMKVMEKNLFPIIQEQLLI